MLDLEEFNECCFVKLDNSLSLLNVVNLNFVEFFKCCFSKLDSWDKLSKTDKSKYEELNECVDTELESEVNWLNAVRIKQVELMWCSLVWTLKFSAFTIPAHMIINVIIININEANIFILYHFHLIVLIGLIQLPHKKLKKHKNYL